MGIIRSADNGNTWIATTLTGPWSSMMVVYGTTIFASTNRTGVLCSTDNGTSWHQAGDGLMGWMLVIHNGYLFSMIQPDQIWRLEILGFNKPAL
jgi:hypothetical protein